MNDDLDLSDEPDRLGFTEADYERGDREYDSRKATYLRKEN
jgi:hypothetical protein